MGFLSHNYIHNGYKYQRRPHSNFFSFNLEGGEGVYKIPSFLLPSHIKNGNHHSWCNRAHIEMWDIFSRDASWEPLRIVARVSRGRKILFLATELTVVPKEWNFDVSRLSVHTKIPSEWGDKVIPYSDFYGGGYFKNKPHHKKISQPTLLTYDLA